jgi:hypothetical protein
MTYIEAGTGQERPARAQVPHGNQVIIETVHHRIHEGEMFSAGFFAVALGAGATMDVLVQTGEIRPHMQIAGQAGQAVRAELYEDTTVSADGSVVGSINRNRNSAKTPGLVVTSGPTVTGVGDPLFAGFIPGGTGPQAEGGSLSTFAEYNLKPNSIYLVRLVNNLAAGTTPAQVDLNWYEPGAS